ncbi:putative zinc-binding dehydrogenase family oxidoreductase [Lojkania enalia]|uniref:Zinc-binding dehydrogenase family oxidoreductase n=1 Tax=Lojkania enalia TaxID=147567 RepID=A0A9P4KI16_9PLEO|nr:putative zinc-binding dehydrogenase family oxidoreductase [Didymosphaeria enalia]
MANVTALPLHQTVIRQQPDCTVGISNGVPLPILFERNMILIKTVAVTLNPCDWKMPSRFPCAGAVDGCDFAGYIVEVGDGVTKPLKAGDKVFGAVHGSNPVCPQSGAFAEYIAAHADFVFKAPKDMAWETASAFGGIGIGTIGVALFYSLKPPGTIEIPAEKPIYVLVNGGASASGTMAIQCLKMAGLTPIATCSPHKKDLVISYGAEKVFDYSSETCASDIRSYTRNSLKYVLDCIATTSAAKLCYAAMGRLGGKYTALEMPPPVAGVRKSITSDVIMGMSLLGKEVALSEGYHRPADPECHAFGVKWYSLVQRLINEGKLKPHPAKVMTGGFRGILEGIEILRDGKNAGTKLVYFLEEN